MASRTLYLIIGIIVLLAIIGVLLTMPGPTPTQTPTQKVFKLGALLPLTGGFSSTPSWLSAPQSSQ